MNFESDHGFTLTSRDARLRVTLRHSLFAIYSQSLRDPVLRKSAGRTSPRQPDPRVTTATRPMPQYSNLVPRVTLLC